MSDIRSALLVLISLQVSLAASAATWKWAGFEVMGARHATRAQILAHIPVKAGSDYREDPAQWHVWCAELKKALHFHATDCSAVRYLDFKAYFVVDVVERGEEARVQYRSAPVGQVGLASDEILSTYRRLYDRQEKLFATGKCAQEVTGPGYLDFSDTVMHRSAKRLARLVPAYRENLFEVIAHEKRPERRWIAANLLNWSGGDIAEAVVRASRLTDDPNMTVRNNLSRFTLPFVHLVSKETDEREIVDRMLIQLGRPSHADRNKSILNLLELARAWPKLRPYIARRGRPLISEIARTSILVNVGVSARKLLELVAPAGR